MLIHSDLLAHIEYGTYRASREIAFAYMLAERDQQAVYLDPVTAREQRLERLHSLFRRARSDITPAIRYAMNVDVDANMRLVAGYAQNEVGALWSYAFER